MKKNLKEKRSKKISLNLLYLSAWEDATNELVYEFLNKYFNFDKSKDEVESWWVAEEIGGVLFINDYFFNLSDIVDFIRHKYSVKKMFEYYDYALEYDSNKHKKDDYKLNIKSYKYAKKN